MTDPSLSPVVTLSSELVADCRVFRVERVRRRARDKEFDIYRLDAPDWVNVLALTAQDEIVFVRQFRQGTAEVSLELPGGMVDPGETPEQAAVRELAEETGYTGGELTALGWVHPNPALQANRCHSFLLTGAKLSSAQSLDEHEDVEVLLLPRARLDELVRTGQITHALMICAFHLLALSGR